MYVASDIVDSDYTFGATPPSQLGNADTGLTSLLDTYSAKTSSAYYLTSSSDISAASSSGRSPALLCPLPGPLLACMPSSEAALSY